jgi:hypothetical protein
VILEAWDLFSQSLGVDTLPPPDPKPPQAEFNYSVGFKDLNGKHNNFFIKYFEIIMMTKICMEL